MRRRRGITRRAALAGLAAAALAAGRGRAGAAAAIREVIERQLRAFLGDDLAGAWGFASPAIQRLFGTPETFGRMVREGYPMIWRPGGWSFEALEPFGAGLRQTVVITDRAGTVHVADYDMVQVEGAWRINGVRLRRPVGTGA